MPTHNAVEPLVVKWTTVTYQTQPLTIEEPTSVDCEVTIPPDEIRAIASGDEEAPRMIVDACRKWVAKQDAATPTDTRLADLTTDTPPSRWDRFDDTESREAAKELADVTHTPLSSGYIDSDGAAHFGVTAPPQSTEDLLRMELASLGAGMARIEVENAELRAENAKLCTSNRIERAAKALFDVEPAGNWTEWIPWATALDNAGLLRTSQ